jgi:hypothetical protein
MRTSPSRSGLRYAAGCCGTALLLFAGCAIDTVHAPSSAPGQPPSTSPPSVTVPQEDKYLKALYADPRLDPIRDKVPLRLGPGAITPAYLTNGAMPTATEKQAIKVWLQVRELAQVHQQSLYGEPSPLLVQTRERITRTIADLYNGKLTYGEFAERVRQIDQEHQTARQNVGLHN